MILWKEKENLQKKEKKEGINKKKEGNEGPGRIEFENFEGKTKGNEK